MSTIYKRPPLTEAVIEIRLASELGDDDLNVIKAKYQRLSWKVEDLIELQVHFDGSAVTPTKRDFGNKYTNSDATSIVQVQKRALSFSRLPPYDGWESFVEEFMSHWKPFRKRAKATRLDRIGVRYINRLDLPLGGGVLIEDYLHFNVRQPDFISKETGAYAVSVSNGVQGHNLRVNLQSQLIPSPIIDHVSITLDIDLFREGVDVPQSDTDIVELFAEMRTVRTLIFEECITDKTRALFS